MKLWMRKFAVILITILTLGTYIPPSFIHTDADENKDAVSKSNANEDVGNSTAVAAFAEPIQETAAPLTYDDYVATLTEKAKAQAITKLGPKIMHQVEDEFMDVILPTMETVLQTVFADADEQEIPYYGITEHPTKGLGEKIFHVYDERTKLDIARFHVRRDNRPLEGYWFNFHYHLSADNFETHHEIGEIYWDKNIPPKWMA
ncbi:hypothetical protein DX933_09210 [Ornithinibacillus gellani]|uniref:YpjP family protein n=1 Tax=Ornithinibacillus gellani TaxID=2293253 RepID=UPI000F465FE2|nr:YpjP family protein [Ornithinibacillus gellani]TQS74936.1 hypothetical protein DX933_09210 [Ornithinibacillus gellani]